MNILQSLFEGLESTTSIPLAMVTVTVHVATNPPIQIIPVNAKILDDNKTFFQFPCFSYFTIYLSFKINRASIFEREITRLVQN